ncbi:MAG: hypothetical protein ACR2F1_00540 [Nitrososphaeraceae archaeon]
MNFKNSNNDSYSSHNESIISQFTKQAVPFTQVSEHSNQYGFNTLIYLNPKFL